jgi:drug/metabolite transporter (DMT)-like permease
MDRPAQAVGAPANACGMGGPMREGMLGRNMKGSLLGIAGGLIISLDALLIRLMQIDNAWTLVALRGGLMWVALVVTYCCMPRMRGTLGKPWPTRRSIGAVLCYAVSAVTFVLALLNGPVAMVLVIISSTPFMTALFAWLLFGERAHPSMLVAAAFGMLGVLIVVLGEPPSVSRGSDYYALATALSMALALVLSARVEGGTVGLPSIGGAVAAICVGLLVPSSLASLHTLNFWHNGLWLLVEGAVVIPLSMGLITLSTRFVAASSAGLFLLLETALGPLWIWAAFGESPSAAAALGGAIIISAVIGHFIYDTCRRSNLARQAPEAGALRGTRDA